MSIIDTHPRGHVLEPGGRNRLGKMTYRAKAKHLAVGDMLSGFGKVLEWEELAPQAGWRMFRMRTERPTTWGDCSDIHTVPEYVNFYVSSLAA